MVLISNDCSRITNTQRFSNFVGKPEDSDVSFCEKKHVCSSSLEAVSNYNRALVSFGKIVRPAINTDFVQFLTADPRECQLKSADVKKILADNLLGSRKREYNSVFRKYTQQMYDQATTLEELVKFRPDWDERALWEKHYQLKESGPLTLGKLPASFNPENSFNEIGEQLTEKTKQAIRLRNQKKKVPESFDISSGNLTLTFKRLKSGQSTKSVYLVEPEAGKKFVVKIDPIFKNRLNRGNSVAQDAIIDYYLTANECENVAKLYYFNNDYNLAIYEYVEPDEDQSAVESCIEQQTGLNANMPDYTALGMIFIDNHGSDNIRVRNGKFVVIDSGYSFYNCSLKPRVSWYHSQLPTVDNHKKLMDR